MTSAPQDRWWSASSAVSRWHPPCGASSDWQSYKYPPHSYCSPLSNGTGGRRRILLRCRSPRPSIQDAVDLLGTFDLRAADALQLSTALMVAAELPDGITFACYDERLRRAAEATGLSLL